MAKTELTRAERILLNAVCGKYETAYEIDSKGRKVRLPNPMNPVTKDDVRDALLGLRAVEEDEMLEKVGKFIWKFLVDKKMVTGGKSGLWFVTTEAQRYYNLPRKARGMTLKFAQV